MVSKNLPVGIRIGGLQSKCRYLVDMSGDNLCIHELLFGSIPFQTVLILGRVWLQIEVLAWCTYSSNGVENKYTVKYSYPTRMQNCEIIIIGTFEWYQKR